MAHVLLTNDDGVSAEGLTTLRDRLLELGLRVSVVAPDGNRSGMARAISFDRPVGVVAAGGTDRDPLFACTGSPVDCVRVGLLSELVAPVDLVVSGINHGLNVGDDLTYSGTVGAALEAAHPRRARHRGLAAGRRPQLPVQRQRPEDLVPARRRGGPAGAGGREPPAAGSHRAERQPAGRGGLATRGADAAGTAVLHAGRRAGRRRHRRRPGVLPVRPAIRSGAALRRQRGHRLRGAARAAASPSACWAAARPTRPRRSGSRGSPRPSTSPRESDERRASPPCPRHRGRRRHRRHVGRLPPGRRGVDRCPPARAERARRRHHVARGRGRRTPAGDRQPGAHERPERPAVLADRGRDRGAGRLPAGRRAGAGAAAGADGAAAPERLDGSPLRRGRADHLPGRGEGALAAGAARRRDRRRLAAGRRAGRAGTAAARHRRGRAPPGRDRARGRPRAGGAARRASGQRRPHRSGRRDGRRGRARVRHVDASAGARLRRQRPAASGRAPLPAVEHAPAATWTPRR